MDILAILAGMATSIVLGLFGSGGSIIATPALLYLLDVESGGLAHAQAGPARSSRVGR